MGPSPAKAAKPSPVKEKVEEKKVEPTKVEIKRDSAGLGLSIVGGSDTPLVGGISWLCDEDDTNTDALVLVTLLS